MTYAQNRRSSAETYPEDGRCSFTNNLSENAIRPFTLGRNDWLFSAIVYTIVEIVSAHDLNIEQRLIKDKAALEAF
jgi:hypothetical protein